MASPTQQNWMSYLAGNVLLDVEEHPTGAPFFWCNNQQVGGVDHTESSVGFGAAGVVHTGVNPSKSELCDKLGVQQTSSGRRCGEEEDRDDGEEKEVEATSITRKRSREECMKDKERNGVCNKANREKERRDRLNDRFLELSAALEPGRPPKTDKASILCDAVRIISQLRGEAKQLKESNQQLREQIKELKTEKNDLRDEKSRLKTEKERLEQQVKAITVPSGYMPHPAAIQAAAVAYAASAAQQAHQHHANKISAPMHHSLPQPGMMWQWLPPGSVDTSQDHVLRPPVA
eukprot:TRINITY_DN21674_c0_g1_i1.p1 TRINITY_DN21674_c0_g1~~TRINITY_DN21674_c0_g1_i1.p1  ORF type:complete len:290 (-),score=75.00 TRINITY_DN21674_c0_g1_i1:945-1814(-)